MKKILSLTLAVLMVVSMIPTAFAAETQDYSLGTAVTVEGAGGEYTVTVPATLNAGQTGTVTAKGYWASNQQLRVTAPSVIEVTDGTQKTNINISFAGINSVGSDLEEMNIPVSISIDDGGIKFGTWTGIITYTVNLVTQRTVPIDGVSYIYETYDTKWTEWVNSEYNTAGFVIDGEYVKSADGRYVCIVSNGVTYGIKANGLLSQYNAYELTDSLT